MILILGGGLAGLSVAYHTDKECLILEKENSPGGLCRSYCIDGFWFDYSGHLLHLRNPDIKSLINKILPDAFVEHERRAAIYSKGTITPFPFQAHTFGLPREVIAECLVGYMKTYGAATPDNVDDLSFRDWVLHSFGEGIAKHFMFPYNEKFWCHDLSEILVDEVQWSIPQPEPKVVINGALGIETKNLGYNPVFLRPANGGIGILPDALAKAVNEKHPDCIRCESIVKQINLESRTVTITSGETFEYTELVSSLPLPVLISICKNTPDAINRVARSLRYISVACVNLGFERRDIIDKHWIYFPEPEFPFFRLGTYSAFSDAPGSSFYVEYTRTSSTPLPDDLIEQSLDGMRRCGFIKEGEKPIVADVVDIPYAYVLHDKARREALPHIKKFLDDSGIKVTGRYGKWEYSSMEDTLFAGKQLAESLS